MYSSHPTHRSDHRRGNSERIHLSRSDKNGKFKIENLEANLCAFFWMKGFFAKIIIFSASFKELLNDDAISLVLLLVAS